MTDKERLEEMEELLNDYYESIDDPFASTDNAMAIIDKVGYFLNRVQELEENLERRDGVYRENVYRMEKEHQLFDRIGALENQNKRYREAINKFFDLDGGYQDIVNRAEIMFMRVLDKVSEAVETE